MVPSLEFFEIGDVLLFDRGAPFGISTIIKFKTWSDVSHVGVIIYKPVTTTNEVLLSSEISGVHLFPLGTLEGLKYVYRLKKPLTVVEKLEGRKWVETVLGQGYDYLGLLAFFWAKFRGKDNNKQFCSELVGRLFKEIKRSWLHKWIDADYYVPADFKKSPLSKCVWSFDGRIEDA